MVGFLEPFAVDMFMAANCREGYLNQSMGRLSRRNWSEAERAASAAVTANPDDERAVLDLVEALRRQGRLSDAVAVSDGLLARRPSAQLWFKRALAAAEMDDASAAQAFESAFAMTTPEDAESLFVLAQFMELFGRSDLAREAARQAVIACDSEPRFLAYLGSLLLPVDPPLAECRLRQALKLDPDDAAVLNDLGVALRSQGKHPASAAAFGSAVRLAPDFMVAKVNLALALRGERFRSPLRPVGLVTSVAMMWLVWNATSFGKSGVEVKWPEMFGALGCFGALLGLERIADARIKAKLSKEDPELAVLIFQAGRDFNEGHIGLRALADSVIRFARVLWWLGALFLVGAAVGTMLILWHLATHLTWSDMVGVGLMGLLAGAGWLFMREGRRIIASQERIKADRS